MKTTPLLLCFVLLCLVGRAQIPTTWAALKGNTNASTTTPYFINDPGREGVFYYDVKDKVSLDNGGTIAVSADGKRFKRLYDGTINGRWFGMVGDYNTTTRVGTDNAAALNKAIAAASHEQTILIPNGEWYINGTITLPLTTVKRVKFLILGNIHFSKGNGFVISGANQDFRCYGIISGGNFGGVDQATYSAYVGDGIYLKNAWNCFVEVNEIINCRNGIHQSGDKSGGSPVGSQYNKIHFNSIHHNYTQIRLSTKGTTDGKGNWNNASMWYGGQVGRGVPGVTYGQGGWYGIVFHKEAGSNAQDPMNGHVFHNVGFEGIERALYMNNAEYNTFIGGRFELKGSRFAIELDPSAVGNKFVGLTTLDESQFVPGKTGVSTSISAIDIWGGDATTKSRMGFSAVPSVTAGKWLITTEKYSHTSWMVNKLQDLMSLTGQFPTTQAMMFRINGVIRAVPYKSTYQNVKSTDPDIVSLRPNIGKIRVNITKAKTFKIDVGDLATFGEEFFVDYQTPAFPITFVRSDNNAVLIPATSFPTAGLYRCVWSEGVYLVSFIGKEYRAYTQGGSAYTVQDGQAVIYVNYPWGNATTTLPSASAWPGREITIKNLTGKNVVLVGVSTSDDNTIKNRGAFTVKSDGVTWNVISAYYKGIPY
jgi:hypothetical protein